MYELLEILRYVVVMHVSMLICEQLTVSQSMWTISLVLRPFHYQLFDYLTEDNDTVTVNSPNSGHFGTTAIVLYLESVLYWGVL